MARRNATHDLLADSSTRALRTMAHAALDIVDQIRRWADGGQSVLQVVLGNRAPIAWNHYPAGDARDTASGYRWYYHCHDDSGRGGEHGHFHLFSELARSNGEAVALTHLVAFGVDSNGLPCRAFTVNRWVTGEVWRDAEQVLKLLARFRVGGDGALGEASRWLSNLTLLFLPQLKRLVIDRDAAMQHRASSGHRPNLREDRRVEVISRCRLSLFQQIQAIDARLHAAHRSSFRPLPATTALSEDFPA